MSYGRGRAVFKIKSNNTWAASLFLHDVGTQSSASILTILRLYASAGTKLLADEVAVKKKVGICRKHRAHVAQVSKQVNTVQTSEQNSYLLHTWVVQSRIERQAISRRSASWLIFSSTLIDISV